MDGLLEVRNISVSIQRPPGDVYAFITNGENVPRWAAGLGTTMRRVDGEWLAEGGPVGSVRVRFAPPNNLGVADHDVILGTGAGGDGGAVHNPIRVVPNGTGSTVTFTLMRQPGVSARQFNQDAKTVERDLETLRTVLEKLPSQAAAATMATPHAADEADIRQRVEQYAAAIRAADLERVMSIFAPDLVSFDLEAPLQHMGAEAKRRNWARAFAAYQHPLGYEIRDLTITVGDDLAFGHSLNRISGTLKNGNKSDYWVRWTTGFRKIDGRWLIVHDHVSVPLDLESGRGLRNLKP
jgi:uncharacterized protein (TIGR02246 family)